MTTLRCASPDPWHRPKSYGVWGVGALFVLGMAGAWDRRKEGGRRRKTKSADENGECPDHRATAGIHEFVGEAAPTARFVIMIVRPSFSSSFSSAICVCHPPSPTLRRNACGRPHPAVCCAHCSIDVSTPTKGPAMRTATGATLISNG